MDKLNQIEEYRKELVLRIAKITGLTVANFQVEVTFHDLDNNHELAVEARMLDWSLGRHDESAWYTNVKPPDGSITVFVE